MEEFSISIPLNKLVISRFHGPIFLFLLKNIKVFLTKLTVQAQ